MFQIHFRINGEWRTKTLTPELWNQLMESFDKQEFIYGKEVFETNIIQFTSDGSTEFLKLTNFDAISITPVKQSGNTRKDNRDSFFPYFNISDLDLSRYQIFNSLITVDKDGKN